jgi:tRNA threonylcarbamoyladenosine biosynthesis protein TsaB
MISLALETSSKYGSIALFRDDQLVEEQTLPRTDGTAKTLAPALHELLARHAVSPRSLDLIAVTNGPGSFTGLRIGIVTAKILAYASKAQVIGVNTLHAIALQAPDEANRVTAILDAQRSQLYVADFHRVDNWLEPIAETRITDRETWIDDLTSESIIIGPVLEKLSSNMDSSVPLAPKESWEPTAVNSDDSVCISTNRANATTIGRWFLTIIGSAQRKKKPAQKTKKPTQQTNRPASN